MPDLLKAMGLTRGSFYKAFTDKKSVYLKALDHYDTQVVSRTVDSLAACEAASAHDCLMPMFAQGPSDQRGCLICNAMVELAPDHPDVAAKTRDMAHRLKEGIFHVLERYTPGAKTSDLIDTADLILHLYFGHQAMGKASYPRQEWSGRLTNILDQIGAG